MATPPPFPLLHSSHPISVHTTPPAPAVVPPPPPRYSRISSDPQAYSISNNAPSNFYFQVCSTSPTGNEQRFLSKGFENQFPVSGRNILPPINTSTQLVNGFSTSVNGMHISNNMFVSPQHGCHSSSLTSRPRLELRRSSEPNYSVTEYDTIDAPPLPRSVYSSPISTGGFVFTQDRQQQPQLDMPQKFNSDLRLSTSITNQPFSQSNHACRRTSTLSKILQTTDDDQLNSKRMRYDRRDDGNRDSEDGDSSGSCGNGCQESGISLSPLRIAPNSNPMSTSSNSSPVTTNSSDTGSMLGEQVPQQQILRQNKGLRHFSKQVCDKVELKGVTTYNEVADELSEDFAAHMQEHGGQKVDQKNIRRRVYDALNVLMAMDIIAKDKKEIRWLGLPGQKNNTNLASSSATTEAEIERQKSEIRILEQQNRRLSKQVDEAKVAFQYKIASRNKQRHDPYKVTNKVKSEKLYLPFKLIRCPRGTVFSTQSGEDGVSQILSFQPHQPNILEDVHILQYIGMDKITPEDMQQWVSPEHLKWIITKQGEDGDYRISYEQ
ncbi:45342_t:CDS:2 [Gigaspora margarita]|uniref:45342_t:CDS:1 n=1 Tax=Gigaspora margarita TaxID=4874 RepID=A0ABN7UR77_GIGMA|nr:45342_t:CDS:2 [Gigaspora margarita]